MLSVLGFSYLFLVMLGVWCFVCGRKHLLNTLMSLEFVVLSLFLLMTFCFALVGADVYFCLLFLTLSVCEGCLGISVLVSIVRTHGNDFFKSFGVLWC